jgi:hypothetical protein
MLKTLKPSQDLPTPIASRCGRQSQNGHRWLAATWEIALLLALATALGFGFGTVVERLTTPDTAATRLLLVSTGGAERPVPRTDNFGSTGGAGLGSQDEIGPRIPANPWNREIQSYDEPDGDLRPLGG